MSEQEKEPLMITPGGGAFPFAVVLADIEQAEQEPVAETVGDVTNTRYVYVKALVEKIPFRTKLYAAPVRTKDLTGDEIEEVRKSFGDEVISVVAFARAVIAADREKNK